MPVLQELLSLAGGSPPSQASGPVGSTSQLQDATGSPTATSTPTTAPSVSMSGGKELLPRLDWAVKGVESNNRHLDESGKVKTSPAGAIGVSQLMPETAASLKVNPYDEAQNAEGGKRYLGEMYDKYGNWTDALMAYNWGPANVDKWIAGDRKGPVPEETQKYVPAVLARLGMTPGAEFVSSRDKDPKQELQDLYHDSRASKAGEQGKGETTDEDKALVANLIGMNEQPVNLSKEAQDESMSFVIGARNGLMNLATGPIQATLEAAAPAVAEEFTKRVNSLTEPYEEQIAAHPHAHLAGEILGTTVGIAGAARLLRPLTVPLMMTQTVGMAARSLPLALRAMGVGAALGGTSFNKDPENSSRLAESALGAGLGLLGQQIARSVGNVLKTVSDKEVVQNFTQLLQKNYSALEPSLSGIKDAVVSRYEMLANFRNRLYATRDAAGRTIEGYPSGFSVADNKPMLSGLASAVDEAIRGKVGRDEATALVRGTAREVDRALGLGEQRDALALWEAKQKEFEKAFKDFDNLVVGGRRLGDIEPNARRSLIDRLSNTGAGAALPVPPPAFEPVPIPAGRMAEARRVVERARQRARDVATRTQLGILKRNLDQTASETAREAGVDVATYERRQALADKFNKEKIAPLQRALGGKTVPEAREQITPAEMYNRVISSIKTNDKDAQNALYEVLGQRGREEARRAIFHDMLSEATTDLHGTVDPRKIAQYVSKRSTGLETLLGRDEFQKLVGISRIAESLTKEYKARGFVQMLGHHPWLLSFAGIKMFEGNFHEAILLGGSAIGVETIRAGLNAIQAVPRIVGPLLPRAARTTVDSAELRAIMRSVDVAMNVAAKTSARLLPQATGGEPLSTIGRVVGEGGEAAGNVLGFDR